MLAAAKSTSAIGTTVNAACRPQSGAAYHASRGALEKPQTMIPRETSANRSEHAAVGLFPQPLHQGKAQLRGARYQVEGEEQDETGYE